MSPVDSHLYSFLFDSFCLLIHDPWLDFVWGSGGSSSPLLSLLLLLSLPPLCSVLLLCFPCLPSLLLASSCAPRLASVGPSPASCWPCCCLGSPASVLKYPNHHYSHFLFRSSEHRAVYRRWGSFFLMMMMTTKNM